MLIARPYRFTQSPRSASLCARTVRRFRRRGAVAVLTAVLLVVVLALVAFAIDMGVVVLARTELQRSADSAALAGAMQLLELQCSQRNFSLNTIRRAVATYCDASDGGAGLQINDGLFRRGWKGITVGELPARDTALRFSDRKRFNTVRVVASRTKTDNGEVPLYFARVLGVQGAPVEATAQATFWNNFRGFRIPKDEETLPFLPFALSTTAWDDAMQGGGSDELTWNPKSKTVVNRPDRIPEIHLYPVKTGSGGNMGTVDVGGNNSNTPTLIRQIEQGLSPQDLAYHGGELKLDDGGGQLRLKMSADPGGKHGAIEPALQSIIGQSRIIPLYESVEGGGNVAEYLIVGFASVRIMAVDLRGSRKHLTVQPAPMITTGGILGQPGQQTSQMIYSPPVLTE